MCKLQLSLVATLQIDAKTAMRDCLHDYSPFCRDTAALQQSAVRQYSAARESDLRHRATALAILTSLRIMSGTSLGKWVFNFEKMLPCSLVFTVFSRGRHFLPRMIAGGQGSVRGGAGPDVKSALRTADLRTHGVGTERRRALCLHMRRRAEVAGIKQRMVWRARTSRPGDGAPCTQHGKHSCKISTHLSSDFPNIVTDAGSG